MPASAGKRQRVASILLVLLAATLAGVLLIQAIVWARYGLRTRWLKSDSGKIYTPGEAAKKVIDRLKEE